MGDFGYVFVNKASLAYGGGFVGMPDNMQEGVGFFDRTGVNTPPP